MMSIIWILRAASVFFLLNLSAELLLLLAQPPVHGQNWVFLNEESPVSEE